MRVHALQDIPRTCASKTRSRPLARPWPPPDGSRPLRAIVCGSTDADQTSTGAACHSGATQLSVTLQAIGLDEEIARGTIRLSVGWYTSDEEIDRAADWLISAWETLR